MKTLSERALWHAVLASVAAQKMLVAIKVEPSSKIDSLPRSKKEQEKIKKP